MDRVVTKGFATFRCIHYWWPRRKEQEAGDSTEHDKENADSFNKSLAKDKTLSNDLRSRNNQAAKRIYILGAGNVGAFVAHSLAGIPDRPPITLLLRRRHLRVWEDRDCSIEIVTHGMKETRRGFEVEAVGRLSENPVPVKDRSGDKVRFSSKAEIDEKEGPPPSYLSSKIGSSWDYNAPNLEESRVADGSLQHELPSDGIASVASVSEGSELSTPQTETNARSAQAEQEMDQTPHVENDMTTLEQIHVSNEQEEQIHHLIVSVKAPQTVRAIQSVAHRLAYGSSILFLQNGMGVVDEINEKVFPDEKYRPTYIVGVVSHGLYERRPFSVVHAGEGTIALGVLPRMPVSDGVQLETLNELSTSARYLMRTMTRTAVFVAVGFAPTELLQQQLDKLAVSCIINPLTAILDCKNGALLCNFYFTRVIRLLLAEISMVIKSLPELKNVPNVSMRFDTVRLERLVSSIANTTAENYSSMVQDFRSGRETEIDYINGYIVKRGEEMGVHCVMNYMLMHMVKGKNKATTQDKADLLPLAYQRS